MECHDSEIHCIVQYSDLWSKPLIPTKLMTYPYAGPTLQNKWVEFGSNLPLPTIREVSPTKSCTEANICLNYSVVWGICRLDPNALDWLRVSIWNPVMSKEQWWILGTCNIHWQQPDWKVAITWTSLVWDYWNCIHYADSIFSAMASSTSPLSIVIANHSTHKCY